MSTESLLKAVNKGEISRRDFIERAMALGVTSAAAAAMLPKASRAETPKRGGRLKMGYVQAGLTETFDQTAMTNNIDGVRAWGCYNSLARVTRGMEAEPMLAQEWEAKPGAREWTFKLRQGVEFHNGKTFEAEDVVASIQRHVEPDSKSPAKPLWEDLAEIKADGKHRVNVTLKSGNALLPMTFAADYHSTIHPAGHTDFNKPVGTGPMRVKEFDPGVRCLFERFENYWKSDVVYLDEVETIPIPDATSRLNALMGGDIHVMEEVDPKVVSRLANVAEIDVVSTPSAAFRIFDLMADRPPTDNVDVRLALKYAIDREQIVQNVYSGQAVVGNDNPVAPIMSDFCADLPQRPYDPEKAAFHWKKGGMEGQTLDIYSSDAAGRGSVDTAVLFSEAAKAAVMDLNVVKRPSDGYWTETWMKFPVNQSGWNARPTADLILSIAHKSDAPWNETAWKNERFDKLLLEGRVELDPARRKEIYCEIQQLLSDEGGALIPVFVNYVEGKLATVKGWEAHPAFTFIAGEFFETAWLDT
ncbi:MAG: ABC transporter substrate-binding protein [Rhodospirillales bacterium]|nr:ABC transporter substrate-binding protein [Rhodospirillales bacterium]